MAAPIEKCRYCGRTVRIQRLKNYGGRVNVVRCSTYPVNILLDKNSTQSYYYGGKLVTGKEVPDGLLAYPVHICRTREKE